MMDAVKQWTLRRSHGLRRAKTSKIIEIGVAANLNQQYSTQFVNMKTVAEQLPAATSWMDTETSQRIANMLVKVDSLEKAAIEDVLVIQAHSLLVNCIMAPPADKDPSKWPRLCANTPAFT